MKISWCELNAFALANTGKLRKDGKEVYYGFENNEPPKIEDFSTEMNETTRSWLSHFGFTFDEHGIEIEGDNPEKVLHQVELYSVMVCHLYEGPIAFCENRVDSDFIRDFLWGDVLGLGGDDDVDYNGSFIDCIVEVITDYLGR